MMKRIILICLFSCFVLTGAGQSGSHRLSYETMLGAGVAMSSPSETPFVWRLSAHYRIGERLDVGAGSGISVYEKTLLPLFADLKFRLSRSRVFTPYLKCGAGYSFVLASDANGGTLFSPGVGVEYRISREFRLLLNFSWEWQRLERLKTYRDGLISAGFAEKLRHQSLLIAVGLRFR